MKNLVSIEEITKKILFIRSHKVILDSDIAKLYGVETRVLIQAVKRNIKRFPKDFMFKLKEEELKILKSQFVMSSWGGRRTLPYVFTEQGVAMLSGVLKSKEAIEVNILIMRAFVKLREIISSNKKLAEKIEKLERKYNEQFAIIFKAIQQLMYPLDNKKKKQIGFIKNENEKK
jgi:hypothetical protein